MDLPLTPELLLSAYASGIFPMGVEDGTIAWFSPDPRAIIPLDTFKASRSLRAVIRKGVYRVTVDRAFRQVISACADREEGTWITDEIKTAYARLHDLGFAHSVEAWRGADLVGGLYGVAIGGAYFGESMFHRATDASKVCLVTLVERLRARGYVLLDTQYVTPHLRRFGAVEIPRRTYLQQLRRAVRLPCTFTDEQQPDQPHAQRRRIQQH